MSKMEKKPKYLAATHLFMSQQIHLSVFLLNINIEHATLQNSVLYAGMQSITLMFMNMRSSKL